MASRRVAARFPDGGAFRPSWFLTFMSIRRLVGGMQEYPVKPGTAAQIDFRMAFEASFDGCREEDGWLIGSFGSMPVIKAKQEGKKSLFVDTETDKGFAVRMAQGDKEALEMALETQRRWNDFLEAATGYNAKQRSKKMQEAAKKAK